MSEEENQKHVKEMKELNNAYQEIMQLLNSKNNIKETDQLIAAQEIFLVASSVALSILEKIIEQESRPISVSVMQGFLHRIHRIFLKNAHIFGEYDYFKHFFQRCHDSLLDTNWIVE